MIDSSATAEKLLNIGAVKFNPKKPYTWASGWKSPIYCDNRKLLSYVAERNYVKEALSRLVSNEFSEAEVVAGVATAGIPWGAMIADVLQLPYIYVRPKPKEHGLGNQIEGEVEKGKKVVVVEDLISTGNSSLQVCKVLKKSGLKVTGMVSIFNYGFPQAVEAFTAAKVPFFSLTNYQSMIDIALEKKLVSESQIKTLLKWQLDPAGWKK